MLDMSIYSEIEMEISSKTLDSALRTLAEFIQNQPPLHFVVCGGSSLLALGMVTRTTTRDVDVLALIQDGTLTTAKPLPEYLTIAVDQIGREMGFIENWFNTGPSDDTFFRFGLPEGLEDRLTSKDYGPALRISYIGRIDQIHLKLYAAADNGPGTSRHSQDLTDLAPSAEEFNSGGTLDSHPRLIRGLPDVTRRNPQTTWS